MKRRQQRDVHTEPDIIARQDETPRVESTSNSARMDEIDDDQEKSKSGFLGGLLGSFKEQFSVQPTESEREALSEIQQYLTPSGLSGEDGVFNHGDTDAIIESLMEDKVGLNDEIQKHLLGEGKGLQARMARRAMKGGRGPLKRMVRNKIYRDAPGMLREQLGAGFNRAGVDPKTGDKEDALDRSITFEEIRAFEEQAQVLEDMKQRAANKMGFSVEFPKGMSAGAMQHTLDGEFGLPPGGRMVPNRKKEQ